VRLLPLLALLLAAAPARAELARTAFWMDLRIGGGASLEGAFFPTPSLVLGARVVGRLQLGGGLSYWRFAASGTQTLGTVLFAPDLSVDLFKARDERVALYAGVSVPLGALVTTSNGLAVGYRVALGVRYCPHPNIAFGVEGGGQGLFYHPEGTGWSNIQSIYGALVGTFYAGRRNEARAQPPTSGATPSP
jgi:hypothetical protein